MATGIENKHSDLAQFIAAHSMANSWIMAKESSTLSSSTNSISGNGPLLVFSLGQPCWLVTSPAGVTTTLCLNDKEIEFAEIVIWKDPDKAAATGRFIRELRRLGYDEDNKHLAVFGDATGPGRPMCDMIRESGIRITPFNFGGAPNDKNYKDEGTRLWYQVAQMIRSSKIVPPPHDQEPVKKLLAQLSQRRQKAHSTGKLWMETKAEMSGRGLKSPDVADAFVMAFGLQAAMSYSWLPYDDSERQEIARRHGWDYTVDTLDYNESYADRRTWNRPPPADDTPGFGGCHSIW